MRPLALKNPLPNRFFLLVEQEVGVGPSPVLRPMSFKYYKVFEDVPCFSQTLPEALHIFQTLLPQHCEPGVTLWIVPIRLGAARIRARFLPAAFLHGVPFGLGPQQCPKPCAEAPFLGL